jgi:hypothetical protein
MRSRIQFGLAALLAVAALAFATSTDAQQSTPASTSTSTAPAATAPSASQPASQQGTPAAASAPAATTGSQTSGSSNSSDRPQFGVPNDNSTSNTPASNTPASNGSDQAGSNPTGGDKTSGDKGGAGSSTDTKADATSTTAKSDALPSPGEALNPHIKKGSEDDVDAVGTRNIGARGLGNWFSTNWEIGTGKQYSMEIEKSAHLVTDPVVVEYVNRVGQNIVKNSDCKVPFTIKVIDSDEINAMALPGGFFYVNSGLIMAADADELCADRVDSADHLHPGFVDGIRDLRGGAVGGADQLPGVLARI